MPAEAGADGFGAVRALRRILQRRLHRGRQFAAAHLPQRAVLLCRGAGRPGPCSLDEGGAALSDLFRKPARLGLGRGGIALGDALRLSAGEQKTGGRGRPALLANALEALIGAVFLEAGYDAARAVVARLLESRLVALNPERDARDPKTALQEWLHARAKQPPRYEIVSTTGPAHAPVFRAACVIDTLGLRTEGEGRSRRHAEQAAAACALEQLQGAA